VPLFQNLGKIFGRWPLDRIYPPLFDDNDDLAERLPRRAAISIMFPPDPWR
jgi:hypothetical protein